MTDDRKSGIALIAGSLCSLLTMAIHPTATTSLGADQAARLAFASGVAHSLGMISFALVFMGTFGLTLRLAAPDRVAFSALVIYGFACVAIFIAAAVSGFIVPNIMRHMVSGLPRNAEQWKIVIDGIFQINQGFARIYSVAASLAIILWSFSALRNGGLGRGIAVYGCLISALIIVGVAIGRIRLDVHGMGAVALGHAIWFIVAGVQMRSSVLNDRQR